MRPIKYRCYEAPAGENYKMFYSDAYESLSTYVTMHGLDNSHMQFTGLHDRNGKEIYESDILQIGKFLFEVVYHNDSFKLSELGSNGKYYFNLIEMIGHAIVCGSIHSNPELLESNK